MKNIDISFPLDVFENLIIKLGWESINEWTKFWKSKKNFNNIFFNNSSYKFKEDWYWGLALPLLSDVYQIKNFSSKRKIIGISALPGTGKTTLGNWIEDISEQFKLKVSVISIDDFYLPSYEMKKALSNNPWNVSRGFPGSHSLKLMEERIIEWKKTGKLDVPVFDKSLRDGMGDRSHWRSSNPDVVILEGWFLGVIPNLNYLVIKDDLHPCLKRSEALYRKQIQNNLAEYLNVWKLIDKIWHLKPEKFEYMNIWKLGQEKEMLKKKGHALKDNKLLDFIRMLNTSIPHKSFDEIESDILIILNQNRKILWSGSNK